MTDAQPYKHAEKWQDTHAVCKKRLKEEGGQAHCCFCVPHPNCEINDYP